MNGLICGPLPLYTALLRLVIEPADIAKNIDRSTANTVEREPAMTIINTVVINPPIYGVILRFYGIVPDILKIIVIDFDVGAAYFVGRASIGPKSHAVISVADDVVANDDAAER